MSAGRRHRRKRFRCLACGLPACVARHGVSLCWRCDELLEVTEDGVVSLNEVAQLLATGTCGHPGCLGMVEMRDGGLIPPHSESCRC